MEQLYRKLYDKYTKLKKQKESALDRVNRDQELKFVDYVTAADQLVEHLRNENDKLRAEVSELRYEVASIRSAKDEQNMEYQKLLIEEKQKYNELSEEVERLQRREVHCSGREDRLENGQLDMPGDFPVSSGGSSKSGSRKRRREFGHEKEGITIMPRSDQLEHECIREAADGPSKENMSSGSTLHIDQAYWPKCCCRKVASSPNATDSADCMFQKLAECLVDLKFSIVTQTDEILITAVHESSGYSFSLRWENNSVGEEELQYCVSSLGTFERVAPEWMREMILFSKSMCPIFFERVSRVINV